MIDPTLQTVPRSRSTLHLLPRPSTRRIREGRRSIHAERGDVPGWVLITLMTAGLVILIWGLAGDALAGVFESAIERVTEGF